MRRVILLGLAVSLAAIGAVVSVPRAAADEVVRNTVLLLLDTSGSMAEADDNGRIKIEGAKAGIGSLINSLPSAARVGLMTYPGQGDCGAPKTIYPIRKLDSATFTRGVSALASPSGGTPTADALRAAADTVQADGHSGTIVLVSDGESNCDADPCAVATDIAAAGIDLTVNTVGFSIDDDGRKELECIANATNGRYVDVQDGDALGDELAKQMSPLLALSTQIPGDPVAVNATSVSVSATVTNESGLTATNVQVSLVPTTTGDQLLGVLRPFVSLGNLAAGQSRTITWSVQVSHLLAGQKASLRVRAQATNAKSVSAEGVLSFVQPGGSLLSPSSPLAQVRRAAVLGDSFSAGDGAHATVGDYADAECRRSAKQYAYRLFPDAVDNFACTGAVMSDLTSQGPSHRPSQLQQLRNALNAGSNYDAVLLTIGGNDIGFVSIARNCLAQHMLVGPSRGAAFLPFLNPCSADPGSALYSEQMALIDAQKVLLQDTYAQIAQTFVSAGRQAPPIIVSPYPLMVPYEVSLRRSCGRFFSLTNAGFSLDQLGDFNALQRRLNAVIQQAVESARAEDGVPVYFAGPVEMAVQPSHTLCSDDQWIVPLTLGNASGGTGDTPMHPNANGHLAIALALSRWSETPGLELRGATSGAWPGRFSLLDAAPVGQLNGNTGGRVTSGPVDFVVDGLAPHSLLIVTIRSSPYPLVFGEADANGRFAARVTIDPALVLPGDHELRLGVVNRDGVAEVRAVPITVSRPIPYWYWALGLLGLGALGAGLMLRHRAKRSPSSVSPAG
ncbi:VWA domain-containing protein [Micropruina sp.]|uniref:VWA domain-containing protein n=1 Tax=Micropruina sp. TaxID=2737536 RepID=UPI0039E460DE